MMDGTASCPKLLGSKGDHPRKSPLQPEFHPHRLTHWLLRGSLQSCDPIPHWQASQVFLKNLEAVPREVAQQSKPPAAFPEDQTFIPSTQVNQWLTATHNSSSRVSSTPFWPLRAHTLMWHTNPYTNKTKKNFFFLKSGCKPSQPCDSCILYDCKSCAMGTKLRTSSATSLCSSRALGRAAAATNVCMTGSEKMLPQETLLKQHTPHGNTLK